MTKDTTKNLSITFLIIISMTAIYFGYTENINSINLQQIIARQKTNTKVVVFTQTLIEKVLKSTTPVDFETRLLLENMVRDLDDKTILNEWNNFVNSTDSNDAQVKIKNLLDLLLKKINIIN